MYADQRFSTILAEKIAANGENPLHLELPSLPLAMLLSVINDQPFRLHTPRSTPLVDKEAVGDKLKAKEKEREWSEVQGRFVVDHLEQALALAEEYQLGPKTIRVFDCLLPLYCIPASVYFDIFKLASKCDAVDFACKILMQARRIGSFQGTHAWHSLDPTLDGKWFNVWTHWTVEDLPVKWVWALTSACANAYKPKDLKIDIKKIYWQQVAVRFYDNLTWRA